MSANAALQIVPAFSAAFLTGTTIPDITLSSNANNCGQSACPALLDFASKTEREDHDAFRVSPVTSYRIIQINPDTKARTADDGKNNLLKLNPIHHINKNLQLARDARLTGDFASAISSYKHVVHLLEQPAKSGTRVPLYYTKPEGYEILTEALLGITALSKENLFGIDSIEGTNPAVDNLERLSHHALELDAFAKQIGSRKEFGITKLNIARTKIFEAFNLMQHTSSASVQHDSLYWQVEKMVSAAIFPERKGEKVIREALIYPDNGIEEAEAHFLGGLLIIEALSRRMELAHKAKNHDAVEKFAERIGSYLTKIYDHHFKKDKDTGKAASIVGDIEDHQELFARYEAEIAALKYKLGLGYHALNRVRTIVEGTLGDTSAAQSLREHIYFEGFFDHGLFKPTNDIAEAAAEGAFWRRLQAAFAYAHSPSLKSSLIAGAVGMITGVALAAISGNPEYGWAAGGTGASVVEGGFQLVNGWNTRQARDAAKFGTNKISGSQTAVDVSKFMAKRTAAGLVWSLPSMMLAVAPEFFNTVGDTAANIPNGYLTALSRLADCPESLFPPLISDDVVRMFYDGNWAGAVSNIDYGHIIYQAYTKSAGLLFLANLISKKARKKTQNLPFFFIPAALMLSADLGLAIAPPDALTDPMNAWWDRIGRATIVGAEMLFMMLTTGLAPLAKTGSISESFKSLGRTLLPIKGTADYNLPLAAMIVTGLSSPLGGIFQQGLMRPEDIPLLIAQGTAITTGLLGLTLGLSGILKRQIPVGASIVRAVRDVQVARANEAEIIRNGGQPDVTTGLWRYPYEVLRGAGSAFNVGYVRNRMLRIPGPDMVASAGRLWLGGGDWDNNSGQAAMSAINGVSGNPYWDSAYPAASGTQHEERSFIKAIEEAMKAKEEIDAKRSDGIKISEEEEKESLEIINDFFRKAGQVIHPLHFFLPHNSMLDRLWPLYSFTKTVKPPLFPQRPNPFLYASVYQVLADHVGEDMKEEALRADPEKLSTKQFELVLKYIKSYATDTRVYHVMRALVKTLLLARNSERFGNRIESFFFKENPHLFSLLSIDPNKEELRAFEERFSRISRATVRNVTKQSPDTYWDRIKRYHKKGNGKHPHDLDGLFQTEVVPGAAAPVVVPITSASTAVKPASKDDVEEDEATPPKVRF